MVDKTLSIRQNTFSRVFDNIIVRNKQCKGLTNPMYCIFLSPYTQAKMKIMNRDHSIPLGHANMTLPVLRICIILPHIRVPSLPMSNQCDIINPQPHMSKMNGSDP